MSRRAKKQQSERAPLSGTRFSNERPNPRKKQRGGRRALESRKPEAPLVVPNEVAGSAAPAEHSLAVEGLALLDVERSFFEGSSSWEPAASDFVVTGPEPATDDDDALLLTPEQQRRRQWFRRRVTTLVAGLGAFGVVAVAVRIASLL